jgi:hypothetical protein
MAHPHPSTYQDGAVRLLARSGRVPVIRIGLALENDLTRIQRAGLDDSTVPRLPVRLGRALTGGTA